MEEENNNEVKNQLPYQPLQFILTETIGAKKKETGPQTSNEASFKDILIPHLIKNHNAVFYLLFHTPSIYNWLRSIPCKEASLLNQYILSQHQLKVPGKAIVDKVNLKLLLSSLDDYISKWEIVKLAFSCKVYVNNTKSIAGQEHHCVHLGKTESYSSHLQYQMGRKQIVCRKINCKQCKTQIDVQSDIREYSNFIILHSFYGYKLQVTANSKPICYESFILISDTCIFVKSANKFWYQVNLSANQSKPIGFQKINTKQIRIAVYWIPNEDQKHLGLAKPICTSAKLEQKAPIIKEIESIKEDKKERLIEELRKQKSKGITVIKKDKKQEPFRELKFEPIKILLKQQSDKAEQYKRQVQQLYIQPKVKDEYELDYDKGKLKKIKQKKTYLQPNFNEIYVNNKKTIYLGETPAVQQQGKVVKKKRIRKDKKKQIDFAKEDDDDEN